MFIKITKSGPYEYAYLVRSYREDNNTKHEYLFNLGRLDQIKNNPSFQNLARRLLALSEAKDIVSLDTISEAQIVNWGYLVYQKIWQEFELDKILNRLTSAKKTRFNLNANSFLMTIQHLLDPQSKLSTYTHQQRYLGLPEVKLQHLYRSLDLLAESKEVLEEELFFKNRNLFNLQVDVVFYDVTTFSFESVRADSLRDFGFSKDAKFQEVQVVMGLLIDQEGRPIGYDLFPGNTFEGKTLETALEKLEKRFGIRRVIIVADKGINSKINLKKIRDKGYDYLLASRLKNLKKEVREEIFKDDYQKMGEISYKVLNYIHQIKEVDQIYELPERLLITYSPQRAQKDKADRERLIEKARSLLKHQSSITASNRRGGKKYLKSSREVSFILDEEAIRKDERFDGYYGIQTSAENLKPQDILEAYHTLWRVEESFRLMKTTLEVRPIFHWTEARIKGHFVICFLAFLLERSLEAKLKGANLSTSPSQIREALNSMNFAEVMIKQDKFFIKTKFDSLGNKILRLLHIKPPPNVTPENELSW
jgi:transposase